LRGELTLIGVFNIQQVISYRGLKTDENIWSKLIKLGFILEKYVDRY
jgi:hypothetical protein